MSDFLERHEIMKAVVYVVSTWLGWIGAMTLAQATAIVGLISAILVVVYTALMIYVLWRDKIIRYRPPSKHYERFDDTRPPEN